MLRFKFAQLDTLMELAIINCDCTFGSSCLITSFSLWIGFCVLNFISILSERDAKINLYKNSHYARETQRLRKNLKHKIRFIDSKHPEHDKKTFNCDHCTKSFIFKASLQKHLENQRTMARNRDKKINLGLMEKNRRKKYDEH